MNIPKKAQTYLACGSLPKEKFTPPNLAAAYTISVAFMGGLTPSQEDAFKAAADRWSSVITGDVPSVELDGTSIDDLLILAQGTEIDGPGRVLGQAGPLYLRPDSHIPAIGIMSFDIADLVEMEQEGTLLDVITHEMGHVIGFGTIWHYKNLLQGAGTDNPLFIGPSACREYGRLKHTQPTPVPVENTGGEGTRDSHWRETVLKTELMTGYISTPRNALSRLTVASLEDLGYTVNLDAAEKFGLPNLMSFAEEGTLLPRDTRLQHIMRTVPIVLPRL